MEEKKKIRNRIPEEVFKDHLKLAEKGELEKDIQRNTADDIVILTNFGVFKGHKGVREAAEILNKEIPNGRYIYKTTLCHGQICFLQWGADSEETYIDDGADSYLIEDGKIRVQTIYYTVKKKKP